RRRGLGGGGCHLPLRVAGHALRGGGAAAGHRRPRISVGAGPRRRGRRGDPRGPPSGEHRAATRGHRAEVRRQGAGAHVTGQIAVIGAGAWGTALAIHLARAGAAPRLWVYEPELLSALTQSRENAWYLPGVRIPDRVRPMGSLADAVSGAELV